MAKRIVKKRLNFRKFFGFLTLLVLLLYVCCTFVHQKISLEQRYAIVKDYESQISEAKLEQDMLKKELEKVNSDEYLEKLAREKLGLIKPNDRVFVDVTKD